LWTILFEKIQAGMPDNISTGFFIEVCAFDGVSVGNGCQEMPKLASKWLAVFSELIQKSGPAFNSSLQGNLSHIQIRFTSANGAASATLSANEVPGVTLLLLSGQSKQTEAEFTQMLAESLSRSFPAHVVGGEPDSFQKVFTFSKRPTAGIVTLPPDGIPSEDHELLREITLHLAGAFF
jgi:hypothetical protein